MIELRGPMHDLVVPGDVVYVQQLVQPRDGTPSYTWRWYGLVTKVRMVSLKVIRGASVTEWHEHTISLSGDRFEVYKLEEFEWPQGVMTLRMAAIMQGRIKLGE